MFSFRFIVIAIIASHLVQEVSALASQGPRFSISDQAALFQGEASLLGSSATFYGNQPLWSGKKNANKSPFRGKKEDQSKSFTPRTKSNQSSFMPKKSSWNVDLPDPNHRHTNKMFVKSEIKVHQSIYKVFNFPSPYPISREARVYTIPSLFERSCPPEYAICKKKQECSMTPTKTIAQAYMMSTKARKIFSRKGRL